MSGVTDPAARGGSPERPRADPPDDSPTRASSLESAVRVLAAATAAGAIIGVLVGGIGGRFAMGVLASLNPEDTGVISDDGFEIGRISLGGTAQLLLTTLQFGLIGALLYLALRTLAIGPTWVRIASLTAGGTVVFGALAIHDGAADAMLGREERDELEVRVTSDKVDVRNAGTVDGGVVRQKREAFSAKCRGHVCKEHLDAGTNDLGCLRVLR